MALRELPVHSHQIGGEEAGLVASRLPARISTTAARSASGSGGMSSSFARAMSVSMRSVELLELLFREDLHVRVLGVPKQLLGVVMLGDARP